jgi:hypothetical protein
MPMNRARTTRRRRSGRSGRSSQGSVEDLHEKSLRNLFRGTVQAN